MIAFSHALISVSCFAEKRKNEPLSSVTPDDPLLLKKKKKKKKVRELSEKLSCWVDLSLIDLCVGAQILYSMRKANCFVSAFLDPKE